MYEKRILPEKLWSYETVILLVDDDEDDYHIMENFLADVRCCMVQLDWVDRYDDALEYMQDNPADVLLVDFNLNTQHNGVELVREIRESGCDVPAILVTQHDIEAVSGQEVLEVVDGYLKKADLNSNLLDDTLCSVLSRKADTSTFSPPSGV